MSVRADSCAGLRCARRGTSRIRPSARSPSWFRPCWLERARQRQHHGRSGGRLDGGGGNHLGVELCLANHLARPNVARRVAADRAVSGVRRRGGEPRSHGDAPTGGSRVVNGRHCAVPVWGFLMVCSVPLVALVFEHGSFTPGDTQRTATAICGTRRPYWRSGGGRWWCAPRTRWATRAGR